MSAGMAMQGWGPWGSFSQHYPGVYKRSLAAVWRVLEEASRRVRKPTGQSQAREADLVRAGGDKGTDSKLLRT